MMLVLLHLLLLVLLDAVTATNAPLPILILEEALTITKIKERQQ